jgi:HSP20 family protein
MGQIINTFFRPFSAPYGDQTPVWVPAADLEETDDAYIVSLELPGVQRDDISIELRDNNEVRISGEVKERERTGTLRRQTRRTGQFEYVMTLPGDVDPEKVDATLHDGVLDIRLGKAAAGQPRQIQIKGE